MPEKLHQHLAGRQETEQSYNKIKKETLKILKSDKFEGLQKDYTPYDDEGQKIPPERKEVVTTVPDRLAWFAKKAQALIDFRATSDTTNCQAKAQLKFNNIDFGQLPTTTLLALEKILEEIRDIYDTIPTRDLTKDWQPTQQKHLHKHGPITSYKTAKKTTATVLYEATPHHPAQIKEIVEDTQTGKFQTTYLNGMASPQQKADWIENIDQLIVTIRKTRMKANETQITPTHIGAKIFQAIHKGDIN